MIELKNLSRIFPKTGAGLASISTTIQAGEWVTLMGPSGSGKTTLLRLISGLDEKTSGSFTHPFSSREIGYVFQDPALLSWRTVSENIVLPLLLRGVPKADALKKAQPWIEKLRLSRFRDSFPNELSGGLRMRVSLARALVGDPKLLLLDEPFAALDEPIRIELGLELRELWKTLKPTILLVTHSITEGVWLADRTIVFKGQPGEVALDRKTELGIERPLSLRGSPGFLKQVEACFQLLRDQDFQVGGSS